MNKKQIIALSSLALGSAFIPTSAEIIPGTDLSVNFESGHIVASGRHLNMSRVPVTDTLTGKTTFYDASFKFNFTQATGFVFDQISSVTFTPTQAVTNITTGMYISEGNRCYTLDGPTLLDNSRSIYTFRGVNCDGSLGGSVFSAIFASGAANGHPDIGDRDIVPNLKSSYIYGYIASTSSSFTNITRNWEANELVGLRQSGNQLIISLFSEGVDTMGVPNDFKDPKETAVLTKINL